MGKYLLVFVSVLVLLASSCKKENSGLTVKELVGTYQFSRITYQAGSVAEEDVTSSYLNDCAQDDQLVLSASRSYTVVDAGASCGTGNVVGEWALIGGNMLKLGGDYYTIRKFDGTNLELSLSGNNAGVPSTLVYYYVRQ